jgi:hypothetical protein
MRSLLALGRHVGAAALAGTLSGVLVGGVLGRLAMRVAGFTSRPELIGVETSNGNRVGEITGGGTFALAIFVGAFAGVAGGILYASAEPWLRSRRGKGLTFGAGLLLALGFTVINPGNFDFARFGYAPLNVAMFALLFVAFGASIAYLFDVLQRAMSGTGRVAGGLKIVGWLAAIAATLLAAGIFFSIGGAGELSTVALVGVAAVVPPVVLWRRLPRYVGYAGFGLPLIVGGVRTLSGLLQIVD